VTLEQNPYSEETVNSSNEFAQTEVIRMAKETGISIFHIYRDLNLPPDQKSQEYLDRCKSAKDIQEWSAAINAKLVYLQEMGCELPVSITLIDPDSEKAKWIGEIRKNGGGMEMSKFLAVLMSKERIESGIPWGTPIQVNQIMAQSASARTVQGLLSIRKTIPPGFPEHAIVIRTVAKFFQKSTA